MKVTGIIAEYNPFHNGHLYQLNKAKEMSGCDYLIIVMSGDFMQRGTPALIDKYTRTRMALSCGADLVLELPVLWATASAEYFASAGVSMLDQTNITDAICFGSETDQLSELVQVAEILQNEPAKYQAILSQYLKSGKSFPAARGAALQEYAREYSLLPSNSILDTPNNILAIEYLKAIQRRKSRMTAYPVKRLGSGYNDTVLPSLEQTNIESTISDSKMMASASAIRKMLHEDKGSASEETLGNDTDLDLYMPEQSLSLLREYSKRFPLIQEDDFSTMLYYKLRHEVGTGYEQYADCTKELSNRIMNQINQYTTLPDFCDVLKSKEVTRTRISRTLLHILLDIKNNDYQHGRGLDYTPYLRVLGFRKDASQLLREIKRNSEIPLITKVADAESILTSTYRQDSFAHRMFAMDLFAADLYRSVITRQRNQIIPNEYTQGVIMM